MKKGLIIFTVLFVLIVFIKYYISDYSLEYKVDNHSIKQTYKDKRIYYEIDGSYNFDVYMNRTLNKSKINKISVIDGENFKCVMPHISKVDTYPICMQGDTLLDYNLIDSELLETYKTKVIDVKKTDDTFSYYHILDNNTFVAIWDYKGYTIVNGKNKYNVSLFENERYDNSLSYLMGDTIYMPNYDEEHEFSKLVLLNITNSKKTIIDLNLKIDYDSYIVGSIKDNIYIFDNKYSILYEYNTKKQKISTKSDSEKGYVKYDGEKFVSCSKGDYKVNKISYDKKLSQYSYTFDNKLYKTIKDNEKIKMIIHNSNVKITHEYKNTLYYVLDDYLYRYTPIKGSEKVLYSYELTFNSDNTIYIYNK